MGGLDLPGLRGRRQARRNGHRRPDQGRAVSIAPKRPGAAFAENSPGGITIDVLAVLQRLGSGRLLEQLEASLQAATADAVASGKPAKVTLSLTVKVRQAGDQLVTIDEAITRTLPVRPPRGAIFYALDGELYRDDPRQPRLPGFRTVGDVDGEVKDLAPDLEERAV